MFDYKIKRDFHSKLKFDQEFIYQIPLAQKIILGLSKPNNMGRVKGRVCEP